MSWLLFVVRLGRRKSRIEHSVRERLTNNNVRERLTNDRERREAAPKTSIEKAAELYLFMDVILEVH